MLWKYQTNLNIYMYMDMMTEEQFFKCQREMQVIDWLYLRKFDSRCIFWIMDRLKNSDSLSTALIDWQIEKDKSDIKDLQPNCC